MKYLNILFISADEESSSEKLSGLFKVTQLQDLPGGPVVTTPCFQCKGHGFDPCSGN